VVGTSLLAKVIGCAWLSMRLTLIHHDQAPARSPSDALPWPPEKRSSVP
jgi:hypothetical protein